MHCWTTCIMESHFQTLQNIVKGWLLVGKYVIVSHRKLNFHIHLLLLTIFTNQVSHLLCNVTSSETCRCPQNGLLNSFISSLIKLYVCLSFRNPSFLCPSTGWRTMFGLAIVPSGLLALGMAFSPESPRWLIQVFFLMKDC